MLAGKIRYTCRNVGFRLPNLVLILQVEVQVGDNPPQWRDAGVEDLTVMQLPTVLEFKHE